MVLLRDPLLLVVVQGLVERDHTLEVGLPEGDLHLELLEGGDLQGLFQEAHVLVVCEGGDL